MFFETKLISGNDDTWYGQIDEDFYVMESSGRCGLRLPKTLECSPDGKFVATRLSRDRLLMRSPSAYSGDQYYAINDEQS